MLTTTMREFCIKLVVSGLGVVSSAAYKKWEKAAIAGVSLVADAAEHLERATTGKEVEQEQRTAGETCCSLVVPICHMFLKKYIIQGSGKKFLHDVVLSTLISRSKE